MNARHIPDVLPIVGDLRDLARFNLERNWTNGLYATEAATLLAEAHEALTGLIRYAEAARMTAGMGKNQAARLDAAKALIAKLEGRDQ